MWSLSWKKNHDRQILFCRYCSENQLQQLRWQIREWQNFCEKSKSYSMKVTFLWLNWAVVFFFLFLPQIEKSSWKLTTTKTETSPVNIYLFKVNNRNIRERSEICSKLTIKAPEQRSWRRSSVVIVNFEHSSHIFYCFYCWLWTRKC